MTAAISRVGPQHRMVIPEPVRKAVGLDVGDFVELRVRGREIVLRPKIVVDKAFIDKRLEAAEADVKAGRVSKPYRSARAALRALKRRAHARSVD